VGPPTCSSSAPPPGCQRRYSSDARADTPIPPTPTVPRAFCVWLRPAYCLRPIPSVPPSGPPRTAYLAPAAAPAKRALTESLDSFRQSRSAALEERTSTSFFARRARVCDTCSSAKRASRLPRGDLGGVSGFGARIGPGTARKRPLLGEAAWSGRSGPPCGFRAQTGAGQGFDWRSPRVCFWTSRQATAQEHRRQHGSRHVSSMSR